MITQEIKDKCIEMKVSGVTAREIYNDYFVKNADSKMSYSSFKRKVNYWRKLDSIPEKILKGASLDNNLKLKWGTVNVDGDGKVLQAWLRGSGEHEWKEDILESIKNIEPSKMLMSAPIYTASIKSLLEIALFDMHIGINTYKDYEGHLFKIIRVVRKGHDHIVITIGSDMFHHNDMRSQTAGGTAIEQLNIRIAWDDALKFYINLINEAIKSSNTVTVIYVKGNHDESLSWAFVQTLKQVFPSVIFEDSFKERKVFTWEKIFIGYIHGDKPIGDIDRVFTRNNRKECGNADIVEIHVGHTHKEVIKGNVQDRQGVMVRVLSTSAKTDSWHDDNNYVGANKRFQLFEYSEDDLINIHYITGTKQLDGGNNG